MRRVHFVGHVHIGNETRPFDPARDLDELRHAMREGGNVWKLVIVDSIVSAMVGDSHKNAEVRKALEPLGALAEETGCAILGITHFTKGTTGREPLERVTGSLAFGAYARIVLATAKRDAEKGGGRIVTRAKSNLGPDGGGHASEIEQTEVPGYQGIFASRVVWQEAIEGTAREILADAEAQQDDGERSAVADAKEVLADLLADGPVPATRVSAEMKGGGFSEATIRRAKKALNVKVIKDSMKGGWRWQLPPGGAGITRRCSRGPEDAHQYSVSTFEGSEHLQVDDGAEVEGEL